jgi:carboxymethylenebutenolidase
VKTQVVSYKSGTENVSAYLALPEGTGKHPAVILIHEWWGLNDWVKEQAQKFASLGYLALAVDLYRGKSTVSPDQARALRRSLPSERAVTDLKAAFDYLASRPDVRADRIASDGWCMGGEYSLGLAVAEPRLAACVVNHGAMPTDPAAIQAIRAPVLGTFGADDAVITPAGVRAFESAMKAAGKSISVKIYDGAGHAFQYPNNQEGYRPEAAKDAWERTVAFLGQQLKP